MGTALCHLVLEMSKERVGGKYGNGGKMEFGDFVLENPAVIVGRGDDVVQCSVAVECVCLSKKVSAGVAQ